MFISEIGRFLSNMIKTSLNNVQQCCQCASACLAPRGCVSRPKRTLSRPKFLNRGFWGMNRFFCTLGTILHVLKMILTLSLEARSKIMDQRYSWFWPNLIDVTGSEHLAPIYWLNYRSMTRNIVYSLQIVKKKRQKQTYLDNIRLFKANSINFKEILANLKIAPKTAPRPRT